MLTIAELEAACKTSLPLDFSRHELETSELCLKRTFYPFGCPIAVRTNAQEVLDILQGLWGRFHQQHDTEPILAEVHVVEGGTEKCPPAPVYRMMLPLFFSVADRDNYSLIDMERNTARISITRAALRHKLYAGYFLLGTPVACLTARDLTAVHAGCVALDGRGIMLCGDSGAGKSTLSYACARSGWTYVSDDGSFLLNGGTGRLVTGNCHQVRFRPSAAELFPEIEGLDITPRAAGKPSVEMPTASMPHMVCTQTTNVDFLVFLKRGTPCPPKLLPYSKEVARSFMRQSLFGQPEVRAAQHAAIERLLTAKVFELQYSGLDCAVKRLEKLAREGR